MTNAVNAPGSILPDYSALPPDWKKAGLIGAPILPNQSGTLPHYRNLYKAFHLCPVDKVKVVMVGQDPYPTLGHPDGLAFSSAMHPHPMSLVELLKELKNDLGVYKMTGSLEGWAKQGVLLANLALTVPFGKPGRHETMWKPYADSLMDVLNQGNVKVFVLMGKKAQKWGECIDRYKHFVIEVGHPSPNNAKRTFRGCKLFSKVNAALKVIREKPIDWGA